MSITGHIIAGHPWTARRIKNFTLRKACRALGSTFQNPDYTPSAQLREAALRLFPFVEKHANILTTHNFSTRNRVAILLRIAAMADHWQRTPEAWRPDPEHSPHSQIQDLIDHLLCSYPIPRFWKNAFDRFGPLRHRERVWFVHVAQGGALRKAPGFGITLSKRARHLLQNAPAHLTISKAIRWAQLQANNLHPNLIERILYSPMATYFSGDAIWLPVFAMLEAQPDYSHDHAIVILDYIFYEMKRNYPYQPSLHSRSLDSLFRSAAKSHTALIKLAGYYGYKYQARQLLDQRVRQQILSLSSLTWDALLTPDPWQTRRGEDLWQIVELTSQRHLQQEGEILRHCISSYGRHCQRGRCAIFSLRLWEEEEQYWDSYLTIQVALPSRKIVQARSICNKPMIDIERQILAKWANAKQIHLSSAF